MKKPPPMVVLGIMSGTSIDAVDCAICRVSPRNVELEQIWQTPFPKSLRARIEECARGASSSHETAQLHHDLGRFYVRCARNSQRKMAVDLIGLHGQTVFHQPHKAPATLQLGEPAYVVEEFRIPVVSNFRAADLAAGGQGAPLATLFHQVVFGRNGAHVCVNNLGGISNVTSLDLRRPKHPRITAFDTGPANLLIDLGIRALSNGKKRLDANGAWANRGRPDERLLARWLQHPFFNLAPPKSTGREMFGEPFLIPALKAMKALSLSPFDQMATLTELTARSLRSNYERHLKSAPETVVLAGGGARNSHLVCRIKAELQNWSPTTMVHTCDEFGWPAQSIEPAAFALLAYYRLHGLPGNFPQTTGAKHPALLGQIQWGRV